MNNEKKILSILGQMQGDIASLKQGQNDLWEEMNDRFDSLESSLKMVFKDISSGEKRLTHHEKEFDKVG